MGRSSRSPTVPLLLFGILLIFTGLQLVTLGLLAELQARTYHESQNKPTYVIREILEAPARNGGLGRSGSPHVHGRYCLTSRVQIRILNPSQPPTGLPAFVADDVYLRFFNDSNPAVGAHEAEVLGLWSALALLVATTACRSPAPRVRPTAPHRARRRQSLTP